jgi:predicted DNA-binding transcriptional regulator AlpA
MNEEWRGRDALQRHELCALHPETLLTKRETARVCGFSISTLDRLSDAPPKLQLSARRVSWRLGDVLAWLASRKAAGQRRGVGGRKYDHVPWREWECNRGCGEECSRTSRTSTE